MIEDPSAGAATATTCAYCAGTAASCATSGIKCCPDCTGDLHQTLAHSLRLERRLAEVEALVTTLDNAVDYSGDCEDDYDGERFTPLSPVVAFIDEFFLLVHAAAAGDRAEPAEMCGCHLPPRIHGPGAPGGAVGNRPAVIGTRDLSRDSETGTRTTASLAAGTVGDGAEPAEPWSDEDAARFLLDHERAERAEARLAEIAALVDNPGNDWLSRLYVRKSEVRRVLGGSEPGRG